jgi:hypothetical protein
LHGPGRARIVIVGCGFGAALVPQGRS